MHLRLYNGSMMFDQLFSPFKGDSMAAGYMEAPAHESPIDHIGFDIEVGDALRCI